MPGGGGGSSYDGLYGEAPREKGIFFSLQICERVGISLVEVYLTVIPRVQMGSESIAHEAKGRIGYWLRGHEGERNNCFIKIQLVGQKYRDKTTLAS